MGANIVRRLMRDGHECVVYDVNPDAVASARRRGGDRRRLARGPRREARAAARGLGDGARRARSPRTRSTRSPTCSSPATRSSTAATPTTATTSAARPKLAEQRDRLHRLRHQRRRLRPRARLLPDDRRPRRGGRAPRPDLRHARAGRRRRPSARPGRDGEPSTAENGYLHCGPSGAGHFVKMVHNGIEYGVMAAYAEGLNILKNADAGKHEREADAETAPLDRSRVLPVRPRHARGRRGLAARQRDRLLAARPDRRGAAPSRPTSSDFEGRVSDSGEGRWTSIAAIEEGVPAPVLTERAVLALRLARPRRLRQQGAVGDAQAVRRPRGEAE